MVQLEFEKDLNRLGPFRLYAELIYRKSMLGILQHDIWDMNTNINALNKVFPVFMKTKFLKILVKDYTNKQKVLRIYSKIAKIKKL